MNHFKYFRDFDVYDNISKQHYVATEIFVYPKTEVSLERQYSTEYIIFSILAGLHEWEKLHYNDVEIIKYFGSTASRISLLYLTPGDDFDSIIIEDQGTHDYNLSEMESSINSIPAGYVDVYDKDSPTIKYRMTSRCWGEKVYVKTTLVRLWDVDVGE